MNSLDPVSSTSPAWKDVTPVVTAPRFLPGTDLRRQSVADSGSTPHPPALDAMGQLQEVIASTEDYDVPFLDYRLPEGFRLSVVIPVFNERDTIVQILGRVYALPIPLEIVLVDDCSTDGTRQILEVFRDVPELKCIFKDQNEGKGAALRTGFERATGDIVIVQDADLEYDPRDIVQVIRPIVEGKADVAYGSRFLGRGTCGSSAIHRFGNRLLTVASNWLTGLPLTDMETCYKAFRGETLRELPLRQNRFGFEPEVTAKIARRRLRVAEVPVRYHARDWDQGKKIGWRDAVNALYCITRYAIAD